MNQDAELKYLSSRGPNINGSQPVCKGRFGSKIMMFLMYIFRILVVSHCLQGRMVILYIHSFVNLEDNEMSLMAGESQANDQNLDLYKYSLFYD